MGGREEEEIKQHNNKDKIIIYDIYIYDYISYRPVATKRRRFSKLSGDRSGPNERGAADK